MRTCFSLIHKYDSFAQLFLFLFSLFYLCPFLHSFSLPCSTFFNVQLLLLPLHTLINEFFLFPSFPAYFHVQQSLLRDYHDFPLFFLPSKVSSFILVFFSGNREQSRQNPSFSRHVSQLFVFCHPFWIYKRFLFCQQLPFSFMSKCPHIPFAVLSRTCFPSQTFCSRSRVCVNKIPNKPANLFAGNCPQILVGEIKFHRLRASAKFRRPLCLSIAVEYFSVCTLSAFLELG